MLKGGGVGAVVSLAGCLSGEESGSLFGEPQPGPEEEHVEPEDEGEESESESEAEDDEPEEEDSEDETEDEPAEPADEPDEAGGDEVVHDLPFEDGFFGMDDFHYRSEYDGLGLDTSTEAEQFARPDGAEEAYDSSRLNRVDAVDTHVVFRFTEAIGRVRLESHSHPDEDGGLSVAASADGEEWADVDTEGHLYSEAHSDQTEPGHWWENYEYTGTPEAGMYYLRVTLSGSVNWSPQLGWLEVEERDDTAEPAESGQVHALPFEDDLHDMDALHESSDFDELWFATDNEREFARPDGSDEETDASRLNRAGSDDAHVVYRFTDQISGLRAETHYHPDGGDEIAVAVSADGEEWTDLEVERDRYSEAHDDEDEPGHWWENYEYTADDIEGGMYLVRFTLSGSENWTSQLGWVEVW